MFICHRCLPPLRRHAAVDATMMPFCCRHAAIMPFTHIRHYDAAATVCRHAIFDAVRRCLPPPSPPRFLLIHRSRCYAQCARREQRECCMRRAARRAAHTPCTIRCFVTPLLPLTIDAAADACHAMPRCSIRFRHAAACLFFAVTAAATCRLLMLATIQCREKNVNRMPSCAAFAATKI